MSQAKPIIRVTFQVPVLNLNESECRALEALVGYGDKAFLEVFGSQLGTHYMRDHEAGLKAFFATVRSEIVPALHRIDTMRRALAEAEQL